MLAFSFFLLFSFDIILDLVQLDDLLGSWWRFLGERCHFINSDAREEVHLKKATTAFIYLFSVYSTQTIGSSIEYNCSLFLEKFGSCHFLRFF